MKRGPVQKSNFRSLMRLAGCLAAGGAMRDAHTIFVTSILVTRTWLKHTDYLNLQRQPTSYHYDAAMIGEEGAGSDIQELPRAATKGADD